VSELWESATGATQLAPHQFISLMVFDVAGERQLSVEAHVLTAGADATMHELLLDWDGHPPRIVSCYPGDRWTTTEQLLLAVASRSMQMQARFVKPDEWGRVMLRVPGPRAGPIHEYVLEMRPTGRVSLWLRSDVLADRYWLPVPDCRWAIDCVSALAVVVDELLVQRPEFVGRTGPRQRPA